MDIDFETALQRQRESKYVEFKESFDPSDGGSWCEVVKDIVAIANTGGGWILFGLGSGGTPSGVDVAPILALDPADIADKVHRYTGSHFSDFLLMEAEKGGHPMAALRIGSSKLPLVFQKPGTYAVSQKHQKTAFAKGTVYFRHGAKSEPGVTQDLQDALERRLEEVRSQWLDGVRKVVNAPADTQVAVLPQGVVQSSDPGALPIRITKDGSAPEYRMVSPDRTYPFRQTELIDELNRRLGAEVVNSHDILCARRVHEIDGDARYYYCAKWGSPQYSTEFADWLEHQYRTDPKFFDKARADYRKRGA